MIPEPDFFFNADSRLAQCQYVDSVTCSSVRCVANAIMFTETSYSMDILMRNCPSSSRFVECLVSCTRY